MRLVAIIILGLGSVTTAFGQSTAKPQQSFFPPQISHVVVIFQENRTPDNLFHFLSPACPIPFGASGLKACTPTPVTSRCYDISPCGLSNKSGTVEPVTLTGVSISGSNDPDHSHSAFSEMCDPDMVNGSGCRNDGAWKIKQGMKIEGESSYEYVLNPTVTNYDGSTGHLLDPYLTFAEQYGWANFMYQTNQGPSYPAHQFMFSGTSARNTADDAAATFVSENFGSSSEVGCLAPPTATTMLLSPVFGPVGTNCTGFDDDTAQECPLTNTSLSYPTNPVGTFCYTKPTMASVLDMRSISWKYYAPSAGSIWTAPNSIQNLCVPKFVSETTLKCTGTEWNANVDIKNKGTDILKDIANCNLSSVSWVIPDGVWSDHAGVTGVYGPSWIAAVINAIGQSPKCPQKTVGAGETYWNNTAIVVTWDDWGGWSDNQPALAYANLECTPENCQRDYQYGFRVPLIVVSAYTPRGFIENESHDFGSILRMIEGIYQIPEGKLGVADARSTTDLSDFFVGPYRPYKPVPALVDGSYFLGKNAQAGPPAPPDNDGDDD